MGWGTDFNHDIYLNRLTFNSLEDVKDHIKEKKDDIQYAKEKLLILISSQQPHVLSCGCSNTTDNTSKPQTYLEHLSDIHFEFKEIFEYLQQDIIELYKLELYLDYLITNNITDLNKDHDM